MVCGERRGQGWRRVPDDRRREIIRLVPTGLRPEEIAERTGVSNTFVRTLLLPLGGVIRREAYEPSDKRLSLDQRVEIRIGLETGKSYRQIGKLIGRCPSTVCREVNNNGGRAAYRPMAAHKTAGVRAKRPKPTKLATNDALRELVIEGLQKRWSPQQISRRQREVNDDPSMQISHETIYKSLYVQGRGELRRELTRCLRTGRAQRKKRGRADHRGRIPDMVMITDRPPEIEDRAIPGHWEGDLIIGKQGKSAVGTLVERTTRFVILLHLPNGHTADEVRIAMQHSIQPLPQTIRRTITWDQGKEMSQHTQFTIDTQIPIYFCDPHSPWQRGSNENTNGLLRQYMPKGTDLSIHDRQDLDRIADSLNDRPRQTLNWMTPSERLNQVLVATTS